MCTQQNTAAHILTILKQPYYNNIKIEDFFLLYTN